MESNLIESNIQNENENKNKKMEKANQYRKFKKEMERKKFTKYEKRKNERRTTPNEIIFIFERFLEDWRPIKIFNVMIQNNPETKIKKMDVDNICDGNVRIYENEVSEDEYKSYEDLRKRVYEKNKMEKEIKKEYKTRIGDEEK